MGTKVMKAAVSLGFAVLLTSCGNAVTDDTEFEGQDTREALTAAVQRPETASVFEKTQFPEDTECVVDAIEGGDLTDEQLRVIITGGDPDPVEDEAWDAVEEEFEDCDVEY